jgi:large subunit ribosomal protein L6
MPIQLPAGVSGELTDDEVRITGPKGKLTMKMPAGIKVLREDGQLKVEVDADASVRLKERELSSRHGLVRALINNMVDGVVKGFEKKLEIVGAGYRPQVQGNKLSITLGFSHPVIIELPEGIKVKAERIEGGARGEERHQVILSGCDGALVGELAAKIRSIRKADVYKGKGVRYSGEVVRRKAGKTAVAAGGTGGK